MESQTLVVVLVGLVIVVVALQVMAMRRAASRSGGDAHEAARAEAQRLATDLQARHDTHVAEINRLGNRLGAVDAELLVRRQQLEQAQTHLGDHQQRLHGESVAARSAQAAVAERDATIAQLRSATAAHEAQAAQLRDALAELHTAHATAAANLLHQQQANADMQAFVADAQARLSGAFAELAGKVFDERGQLFEKNVQTATAQGKTDIETLLKPFADKLGEFRSRVDVLYGEEAKERSALFGAVTELKTLNQDMAGKADALTRALKGSSKVRGDWGELMLESVLRGSGLEAGVHYDRQTATHDDDGARLLPDIVVRLPDDRRVVIDSKVNLIAWQEAMNAETPELHDEAVRRHAVGLRRHVKDLGEKNYPRAIGERALEITIAFVPIEGALSAALGSDNTLQTHAFDNKVVFASPNTLMALLRVVERLWTRDKTQREAQAISDAGGKVLDALQAFIADFDAVGAQLGKASTAFESARKRLSESNQAVIPRARRLADLGARGRKALSAELASESSAGEALSVEVLQSLPLDLPLGEGGAGKAP